MRTARTPAALVLLLAAGPPAAADPPPGPAPPAVYAPAAPLSPAAVHPAFTAAQDPTTRVYLVNGADPFQWAGMGRLADRVRLLGYPRTRYGETYDIWAFEREIRETHREDPTARFVLVGFSAGTLAVRAAANRLVRDGIPVAMLGYIGGDYLGDTEYSRPGGVGRVVNVTGNGFVLTGRNLIWNGTDITGAANARLRGVEHFGLPLHPLTFRMLAAGLAEVSAGP